MGQMEPVEKAGIRKKLLEDVWALMLNKVIKKNVYTLHKMLQLAEHNTIAHM